VERKMRPVGISAEWHKLLRKKAFESETHICRVLDDVLRQVYGDPGEAVNGEEKNGETLRPDGA